MTGNSPDDFASALRDKPMQRPHGVGGDGGQGGARVLGMIFLGMGLFMLATQVWMPIRAAQAGATSFHFSSEFTWAIPALVIVGTITTLFGLRGFAFLASDRAQVRMIVLGVILAALGIALHFGTLAYLESLGYRFESRTALFGIPLDPAP